MYPYARAHPRAGPDAMEAMLSSVQRVPGGSATVAVAGVAACYWCTRGASEPSPQDLVAPDGELDAEAIAALRDTPDALAGVYSYDGSTGVFTLAHTESGVPYDKTEKETIKAEATLSLKASRCARLPAASSVWRSREPKQLS